MVASTYMYECCSLPVVALTTVTYPLTHVTTTLSLQSIELNKKMNPLGSSNNCHEITCITTCIFWITLLLKTVTVRNVFVTSK